MKKEKRLVFQVLDYENIEIQKTVFRFIHILIYY